MRALPTGTVTFLFTDIEGSTRLLDELGDRYVDMLAEHRRVLRHGVTEHGGIEVDTQGDSFFFAFAGASEAVSAARAAQQALGGGRVRVRMGLHTGEPTLTEEGYAGMDVHRAARVAAAGHGGQVLVSETTAGLVDAELRDLGEHRLKDLTAPVRIYQLGDGDFPPLKTLYATNLPVQPAPLVGRGRELVEIAALLREHRLVTLTGPGGSGKTRLALQAAADAVEEFEQGVWWVPLQALRDPALVEPAVAQALGASGGLAEHIRQKRLLVLLDNFEQVVEAAGAIAALVATAPNVRVLVTSREPLDVPAERTYPIDPLPREDAVELFRRRAAVAEPVEVVAEICRRLDGLPLAVELAAARTRLLEPAQLLARLERALPILTSGARDAPERQRTLAATIRWSFDLLSDAEQSVFRRLSVFAGSFDVEAAVRVAEADLDTLQSLVEKSLVRRWGSGRLGMLETIHEFAEERLEESGEADAVRGRHADSFLELAERRAAELRRDRFDQAALDALEAERQNLRAALDWSARARPDTELRLAAAAWLLWCARGPWDEGWWRLQQALERNPSPPQPLLARVHFGLGEFAWRLSDGDAARRHGEAMLQLCRELGDETGVIEALITMALGEWVRGNLTEARSLNKEAAARARKAGEEWRLAVILNNLGCFALQDGDLDGAEPFLEESLQLSRRLGQVLQVANNLVDLGLLRLARGRTREAVAAMRESASLYSAHGGSYDLARGALIGLAGAAAAEGEAARAARLLGAADAQLELAGGEDYYKVTADQRDRAVTTARAELGEAAYAALWAEGHAMAVEDALAYALGEED
jgi:predicted ATPase